MIIAHNITQKDISNVSKPQGKEKRARGIPEHQSEWINRGYTYRRMSIVARGQQPGRGYNTTLHVNWPGTPRKMPLFVSRRISVTARDGDRWKGLRKRNHSRDKIGEKKKKKRKKRKKKNSIPSFSYIFIPVIYFMFFSLTQCLFPWSCPFYPPLLNQTLRIWHHDRRWQSIILTHSMVTLICCCKYSLPMVVSESESLR